MLPKMLLSPRFQELFLLRGIGLLAALFILAVQLRSLNVPLTTSMGCVFVFGETANYCIFPIADTHKIW